MRRLLLSAAVAGERALRAGRVVGVGGGGAPAALPQGLRAPMAAIALTTLGGAGGGGGGAHGFVGAGLPGVAASGGAGGYGGYAYSAIDGGGGGAGGGGAGGYGAVVTGTGSLGTLGSAVTGGRGGRRRVGRRPRRRWNRRGRAPLYQCRGRHVDGQCRRAGRHGWRDAGNGPNVAGSSGIVGQNLNIIMGVAGSVAGGLGADAITFTGGANTLTFSKATTGLSGNIGVTGSLTFDQSGIDTTVGNVITGSGSVVKTGTHAITLSGVNTYIGGTTINGGVLSAVPATTDLAGHRRAGVRRRRRYGWALASIWRAPAIDPERGGGSSTTNGFNTTVSQAITGGGVIDQGRRPERHAGVGGDLRPAVGHGERGAGREGRCKQDHRRHGDPLRQQHLCGRHRDQRRHARRVGGRQSRQQRWRARLRRWHIAILMAASRPSTASRSMLGGSTFDTNGNAAALSGSIGGTDGLTKTGWGTLILSGASTYTGVTAINGGTLQLGDGGATGAILGAVAVGTSGTFNLINADTSGITSISNAGITNFRNNTSAGSATIANGGTLHFYGTGTAGSAAITNDGHLYFYADSKAGNATITNNNILIFSDGSTAGTATITTQQWRDDSLRRQDVTGGLARFITTSGGQVDISGLTTAGMTAGSIAGAGSYFLGSKELSVGGNNLSTEVSGVIADGGAWRHRRLAGQDRYRHVHAVRRQYIFRRHDARGGDAAARENQALGTGALTTTGSVVDYANGVTIANPIVVNSDTTQLSVTAGTATQAGAISELNGPRPLEKIGAGTWCSRRRTPIAARPRSRRYTDGERLDRQFGRDCEQRRARSPAPARWARPRSTAAAPSRPARWARPAP